jgi:hypothetical protein
VYTVPRFEESKEPEDNFPQENMVAKNYFGPYPELSNAIFLIRVVYISIIFLIKNQLPRLN